LDNNLIIRHIDEVEKKIDTLVGAYAALKKENTELLEQIKRIEQALQEKSEAVMQYAQERDLVRSRIDALLSRLGDPSQDALIE